MALSAAALVVLTFILPSAYRNYKVFKAYGPGITRCFGHSGARFSARMTKGHGKGDEGFLLFFEEDLGSRYGEERRSSILSEEQANSVQIIPLKSSPNVRTPR
ncbi:uncharacterized protein N7479_010530 [Penicillium vulpinum]|uniref:uncharacterized protein n=1 Tax=Penicillium vulpinum TaxID=29845 RepID=UPI00254728BB|nr:uncharacterized protein N7479_010530 [Penicillium vulpinum]KAJ5952117.1 hypothetical protein N7479_010530 [Penicillium vulpinum]